MPLLAENNLLLKILGKIDGGETVFALMVKNARANAFKFHLRGKLHKLLDLLNLANRDAARRR